MNKKATKTHKLYRSETNRVIGGVAGGLGEYFNLDPLMVRIIFILFFFSGATGLFIYLLFWLIIPSKSLSGSNTKKVMKENSDEIKIKAKALAEDLRLESRKHHPRLWLGAGLIILGVLLFLDNFGFFRLLRFINFWPLALIFLGILILNKNQNA